MRYKIISQFFAYMVAKYNRLERWLRLHGFPVVYIFLYQPTAEQRPSLALLRRIQRLHRIGFQLHSLLALSSEQRVSNSDMFCQKERLPTAKTLLSKSTSANANRHSFSHFLSPKTFENDQSIVTSNVQIEGQPASGLSLSNDGLDNFSNGD